MKTAEEILDSHYEPGMHWKTVNRAKVLAAMESYHNQYAEKGVEDTYLQFLEKTIQQVKDSKQFLVSTKNILLDTLQDVLCEYQLSKDAAPAAQGESAGAFVKAKYDEWLKETSRSGSVLVGSSLKEFFKWLDEKK